MPPSSASSANSQRTKAAAQGRFCLSAVSRRTNNTASHAAPHARLPLCPTPPDSAHARTEPSFLPLSHIFVCATDGSPGQTYPHPAAAPDILILRLVSAVKAPEATPLPEIGSLLSGRGGEVLLAQGTRPVGAPLLRAKHGAFLPTGARPPRENMGSEPRVQGALVKLTPLTT